MPQIPPLVDKRVLKPAQTALALELVSRTDLLRLKSIARLYARESAAFVGVTYPGRPQLSDYFDLEAHKKLPPHGH